MKKGYKLTAILLALIMLAACGANPGSQDPTQIETEDTQMEQYTLSNPNANETTKTVYEYI